MSSTLSLAPDLTWALEAGGAGSRLRVDVSQLCCTDILEPL